MTLSYNIRQAVSSDLVAIKKLCDKHRVELGFVLKPSLEKSIELHEIFVAVQEPQLVGFVHYHHRRDGQTTLYHLAVEAPYRRSGVASRLVQALVQECRERPSTKLLLKCPTELDSNHFYEKFGFHHEHTESGKNRALNVWSIEIAALPAAETHLD